MIKHRMTVDLNVDGSFTVCVDGGHIECPTRDVAMATIGSEMGMSYQKAQRQLLSRALEAEKNLKKCEENAKLVTMDRNKLLAQVMDLREEVGVLKSAITGWFVRTYTEENAG